MILISLLLTYLLYVHYCAYVALRAAQKRGQRIRKLGWLALAVGVTLDAIFNLTLGSLLFLELPKEWMFTSRCSRHLQESGWRGKLARWICYDQLNPIEENHCH